jgi:putative copper export protein
MLAARLPGNMMLAMENVIVALEPFARASLFLSLMILVGLPISQAALLRGDANAELRSAVAPRVAQLQRGAALVLGLATVLLLAGQLLPLQIDLTSQEEWRAIVTTALFGQMALARMLLWLPLLAAMIALRNPAARGWTALLFGLLGNATITRGGHAMSMEAGLLPILSDFMHQFGGGLWAGGLIVLGLAMDAMDESAPDSGARAAGLIRRFSPLGMIGVALVGGTGLVLTGTHVPTADKLLGTPYGNMLLLKVLLVCAALALAGWHRYRSASRMSQAGEFARFKRTLWIETLIVLVVFFAAALLVSGNMPGVEHGMEDVPRPTYGGLTFQAWLNIASLSVAVVVLLALGLEQRRRRPETRSL